MRVSRLLYQIATEPIEVTLAKIGIFHKTENKAPECEGTEMQDRDKLVEEIAVEIYLEARAHRVILDTEYLCPRLADKALTVAEAAFARREAEVRADERGLFLKEAQRWHTYEADFDTEESTGAAMLRRHLQEFAAIRAREDGSKP